MPGLSLQKVHPFPLNTVTLVSEDCNLFSNSLTSEVLSNFPKNSLTFLTRAQGYKTFSILNSVKHEINIKYKNIKKLSVLSLECYFAYP